MENAANLSSKEELLKLKNEGRITEEEYQELLEAINKNPASKEDAPRNISEDNSKSKLGKIAVVITLAGIILPFPCYFIIEAMAPPNGHAAFGPWFGLGIIVELVALDLGIKSWRTENGKAAAIASGIIIFLAALFTVLNAV